MDKDQVERILYDLYDNVQSMREEGETDLRTVLYHIDSAIQQVKKL